MNDSLSIGGVRSMQKEINEMASEVAKHTENMILEQLNELISRGLLIVEKGPMSLTTCDSHFSDIRDPYKIKVSQIVRLVLKDREYIERLEKENAQMRGVFEAIKKIFTGNLE